MHNKQSNTNQDNSFFEKGAALGGTRTHDTPLTRQSALPTELPGQLSRPLTRQSALPTELPGQLSRQGSKSITQHNTRQSQTPIIRAIA